MAKQSINTLKQWFQRGLKPLQQQFWDLFDSYFHKDDEIPAASIGGLTALLDEKTNIGHTHDVTDITDIQGQSATLIWKSFGTNADGSFPLILLAGYSVVEMRVKNNTANAITGLAISDTVNAALYNSSYQSIGANEEIRFTANPTLTTQLAGEAVSFVVISRMPSVKSARNAVVAASGWNGGNVTISFLLIKDEV